MTKRKKKILYVVGGLFLIGLILLGFRYYKYTYKKIFTYKSNISTFYKYDLNCSIEHSSGFYNPPESYYTEFTGLEEGGLKFTFKDLTQDNVTFLISDANGVQDGELVKIVDTDVAIQLIRTWSTDESGIELFTIYKKTGFFSYAKSGEYYLLGTVAKTAFGTCH